MKQIFAALIFVVFAPVLGAILAGIDRIVTARMQSRIGPPLLQPLYDVLKLFEKRPVTVNRTQNFYIACFLIFVVIAGAIVAAGGDLLLSIFALTVGGVFLVLGGYCAHSPYSTLGAERELLQMLAYEPMLILTAVGMFMVAGSFHIHDILASPKPLVVFLPGVLAGYLFILTIKLRKSPFDLSTSHHGHQELVKGITTEFSGQSLAWIEIAHWYENVLLLAVVYFFFAGFHWTAGVAAAVVAWLLELFIDNVYARLTWRVTLVWAWWVTALAGVVNLAVLAAILKDRI